MARLLARLTPLLLVTLTGACATLGDGAAGLTAPTVGVAAGESRPAMRWTCASTIRADAHPLFVVDGHVHDRGQLGDVSAAEIESIEVLKGPAAAAIFGSRGLDGVIVITTRRARSASALPPSAPPPTIP